MVAAMDWSNERYIRLYIRDTLTWKLWTWEARSLFCLLGRKCDRAGIIDIGPHDPVEAAAAIAEVPLDVAGRALPQIIKSGTLEACEGTLVFPAFIEAQEAKSTDKHRQRETRARRRSKAMASHGVTPSHVGGHTPSQMVTPSLAKPSQAEPSLAKEPSPPRRKTKPPSPAAIEIAQHLFDCIAAHSPKLYAGDKPEATEKRLTGWCVDIDRAIRIDGMTVDGARLIIDYAHHPDDPGGSNGFTWHTNLLSGGSLRTQWKKKELLAKAQRWRDGKGGRTKSAADDLANFDFVGARKAMDDLTGAPR